MLNISLHCKSAKETKPSINVSELLKAGLLKKAPKDGEQVVLKLVNSGGIVAEQDFYGSRGGKTLYAKNGFNDYLFDAPEVGVPTTVGVCGVVTKAGKTTSQPAQRQTVGKGLSALNKLVKQYGTKVAAAQAIGVSVDTLRRMFKRAELEAKTAAPKKASTGRAMVKTTRKTARASHNLFTKASVKEALRKTGGNKAAAANLLGTNPRTLGRAIEKLGL